MKYCEPHRPFSSPAVPQKDDAALGPNALGRAFRVSVRHGQQPGGTGAIVIGAVVDVVAVGQRRAEADVIEVRADDDIFVLQYGVAAFENADHVFGVIRFTLDGHFQAEFLGGVQLEGILFGVGPAA